MKVHKWITLILAAFICAASVFLNGISMASQIQSPIADDFRFPLDGEWSATRDFASQWINDWCGYHLGEDISRSADTPVYPTARGKVKFAMKVPGLGYAVIVEHELPQGDPVGHFVTSIYYHMKTPEDGGISWTPEDEVSPDAPLGYISGEWEDHQSGPHLHFGIRLGLYQEGVDPRTEKWFYPGYTAIYQDDIRQCDENDSVHAEIISAWRNPAEFILEHQLPQPDFPVDFPDPNLESGIREAISKPSGDIMYSDLQAMQFLDVDVRSINNLEGIQYCINLKELHLWGNFVSDLSPLASLVNLDFLDLSHNQVSDLTPLTGLVNLEFLQFIYNQVSDLTPLSGLTNLKYLFVYNNQISDLNPLATLTKLESLRLDNNQISDLTPLGTLTNLPYLDLSNNQISDLTPLTTLINLTDLELDNNQITDILPLINNSGIDNGDLVFLYSNPLNVISCTTYIPQLESGGVSVFHDCP